MPNDWDHEADELIEKVRLVLIYKHARERDMEMWLANGAKVGMTEYFRRKALVDAVRKSDKEGRSGLVDYTRLDSTV